MKMKIDLLPNPNPQFREVAKIIADGPAPEWLVTSLEHFSDLVGGTKHTADDHAMLRARLEEMQRAVDVLLTWLPAFAALGLGLRCPDDVRVVLEALPRIKLDLDLLGRQRTGSIPNVPHVVCAQVVLEASKLIHGKASAGSVSLQRACMGYWRACGHREHDVPENWRRHLGQGSELIRSLLVAVQNQH
jgi:hypothetical protein